MIKSIYKWFYYMLSGKYRGERFSGPIQTLVRGKALSLCADITGRALEIGSGSGLFISELALLRPQCEIYGVDINEELCAGASSKLKSNGLKNARILRESAFNLSFPENYFDTVICVNFLITLGMENICSLIKEAARVLKPGGRFILEFRNLRNLPGRIKYSLASFYDDTVPDKLRVFSEEDITGILKGLNFGISRKLYIGFPSNRYAPIIMVEAEKI